MENKEVFQKALNYAYFYLKFRNRTEQEIVRYLEKKAKRFHWSETLISAVVESLKEQGLVDDEGFVRWFISQRNISKPRSAFILKNELMRLGIKKDMIDGYFLDHPQDEEGMAYKSLSSRWRRWTDLPVKERFKKAAQHLLRKGFSFETCKRTIAKIEGKE